MGVNITNIYPQRIGYAFYDSNNIEIYGAAHDISPQNPMPMLPVVEQEFTLFSEDANQYLGTVTSVSVTHTLDTQGSMATAVIIRIDDARQILSPT